MAIRDNENETADMTIGRLARAAGVGVETIRYYERCGLLIRPKRSGGAYRRYPRAAVEHIAFIKRVQSLGFSLQAIRQLVDLDNDRIADGHAVAASLLEEIRRRLHALKALEGALHGKARGARHPKSLVQLLKTAPSRKA